MLFCLSCVSRAGRASFLEEGDMRKELELIKLMNERGQICTETIEKSKDSLLQFLARRELEIITEYTRILDALEENKQRKEEAESRVKTKEEVIESLEKESSELNDRLHRLSGFLVREDETVKIRKGHLSLMDLQRISMILYSKVLDLRIEDLKR